jgi:SAM domain (Sterile alpha motif)
MSIQSSSLDAVLGRIGLQEYYNVLTDNGYSAWTDVLSITEEDLCAMGFKLGHRRRLQREIASFRGHPLQEPLQTTEDLVQGSKINESASKIWERKKFRFTQSMNAHNLQR